MYASTQINHKTKMCFS